MPISAPQDMIADLAGSQVALERQAVLDGANILRAEDAREKVRRSLIEAETAVLVEQLVARLRTRSDAAEALVRASLGTGYLAGRNLFVRRQAVHQRRQWRERLSGSSIWSADEYRAVSPHLAGSGTDPLSHYVVTGWRELRNPHPLFDVGWYLVTNPDVFARRQEPLSHYITHGASEGRRPNVGFDGSWYLRRYPDVAAAGLNPLDHYITSGAAEGRWPHPLFDVDWYERTYRIDGDRPWKVLAHYVRTGHRQGLKPNRYFDPNWYVRTNVDIGAGAEDPLYHYLTKGWREGSNPSRDFDGSAYLSARPDVAAQGDNPLAHFLGEGGGDDASVRRGGRGGEALAVAFSGHGRSETTPSVLYVTQPPDNLSHSYRVRYPVETLLETGTSARWISQSELGRHFPLLRLAKVVVFARLGWTPEIARAVEECRKRNVLVVFDVDDYVFDPAVANTTYVDGLRFVSRADLPGYYMGVAMYAQMLTESDVVLASTPRLVEAAEQFGKPAFLLPNGLRASLLDQSRQALLGRPGRETGGQLVLGYASGTKTHQRDFKVLRKPLIRVLRDFPHTCLQIIGDFALDEFPEFGEFGNRVIRRPRVPIEDLSAEYARFDINLAPLEIDNPYCEAKSALKFHEAGLVGIPTVASATEPFRQAIRHGETGYLARTERDWYDALKALVLDGSHRTEMGQRALHESSVVVPGAVRKAVRSTFDELLRRTVPKPVQRLAPKSFESGATAPTALGPRLRIGWVVPGLVIGGGGHRNILRSAHFLRQFGHDVALYFTKAEGRSPETLRSLMREHFYPFDGKVFLFEGQGTVRNEDVIFATHWSTVGPALELSAPSTEVIYFVQDFEPAFAPMSSEYILAENTYRKGLYAITSGRWCENLLRTSYGMEADHIQFPIDREIYYPRPEIYRERRVLFFAKPEMPRRCFELGIAALRVVKTENPDVEVVLFGSPHARDQVDFPVTCRDVLPGVYDLAYLYAGARLGMVFSTTNPSLVPYEMLACGLPVVDLGRPGNEVNFDGRTDIAFLADPEPEIMAEQISALLDDEESLARRASNGMAFVATFPSELEMVRRLEMLVLKRLQAIKAEPPRVVRRPLGLGRAARARSSISA